MSTMVSAQAPAPVVLRLRGLWRLITQNRKVAGGLGIVAFFILLAICGPFFFHDPNALGPASLAPPSAAHWFGTTQTGQDVFAQVVAGSRTSVLAGLLVGLFSTLISILIGLSAGYFGGLADEILSLLVNIFLVLPGLPLAIVLATYSPVKGPLPIILVLALTSWAWGARVLRAQTLSLRQRDFVESARASGEKSWRIICAEILPNEMAVVVAGLIGTIIYAILAEASLEFLGLGDISNISWGTMFYWAENNNALLIGAWWWFLPPGLCIAILGAGLTLINFGIDEIANPQLRVETRHPETGLNERKPEVEEEAEETDEPEENAGEADTPEDFLEHSNRQSGASDVFGS
jgi:peptide/nickel transport system permease protein